MGLSPSFRRPNTIPSGAAHPTVVSAIRSHDASITDLNQAVASLKGQIGAATATSTGTTTNTTTSTENVTNTTVAGGPVNNQSGSTTYITAQTDNGALVIFSDASAVAVTLNQSVTLPWYCFIVNLGPSIVTLTPQLGLINNGASQPVGSGYFTILGFDGANFYAGNIPIVPVNTPAVAHQWLASYNATTGAFTLTQPSFADVSGIAAIAQGGTGTATPGLVAGTNISITGTWPDQTVATVGFSGTITTAQLTVGGTQGSMTFSNGILVNSVPSI